MNRVGLHLRYNMDLEELLMQAHELKISLFQFFLTSPKTKKYAEWDSNQMQKFAHAIAQNNLYPFIHGSYKINPSSGHSHIAHYRLEKELVLAKRLGCTYLILHPGSAVGCEQREDGIDCLARTLNNITKKDDTITLVLENTAHGKKAVGSDLDDFYKVRTKLDKPERIKFCIDTAHAFVYGYDIKNPENQDLFIAQIEETIGIENIVLLHINDAYYHLGSKIDRHVTIGNGAIGFDALSRFAMHPKLKHIPIILELPHMNGIEQKQVIEKLSSWK